MSAWLCVLHTIGTSISTVFNLLILDLGQIFARRSS